jgi:hypothetical protein
VLALVALIAVAFVVARSCQQSQVRVTEEQAVATAEREVDFEPRRTQIRLLRQGIDSKPYWIVSLSVPGRREGTFSDLAVVGVNANTGKVGSVDVQP